MKREYSWRCPKFLQERRRWWQSPGKILKKAVYFFTSFPSYLLISFALSTSPPSLFLSFLILPLDFWAIFFHFLYILAHSSDTLLREIYFVKDSGRQIQRNEPSIVKIFLLSRKDIYEQNVLSEIVSMTFIQYLQNRDDGCLQCIIHFGQICRWINDVALILRTLQWQERGQTSIYISSYNIIL